jgi:hypothetical protein
MECMCCHLDGDERRNRFVSLREVERILRAMKTFPNGEDYMEVWVEFQSRFDDFPGKKSDVPTAPWKATGPCCGRGGTRSG